MRFYVYDGTGRFLSEVYADSQHEAIQYAQYTLRLPAESASPVRQTNIHIGGRYASLRQRA
jgi:hypothetical protein